MHFLPALACALLLLAAPTRAGSVVVVDSTGSGDFVEIQPAIDFAQDGDTILVRRPPNDALAFDGFVIDGKAVNVVGPPHQRVWAGPSVVKGLAVDQDVLLSGLGFRPDDLFFAHALTLVDNRGGVRLERCTGHGSTDVWMPVLSPGGAGCRVRACADVVVVGGDFRGGIGSEGEPGGSGLWIDASCVYVHDSDLAGGEGGNAWTPVGGSGEQGGRGGDGVRHATGRLYVSRSTTHGGAGGWGLGISEFGGNGGDGVLVLAPTLAWLRDTTALAGAAGSGLAGPGLPGESVVGNVSTVSDLAAALELPASAADTGGSVRARVTGSPGHEAFLLLGDASDSRLQGPSMGPLHVANPFRRVPLGTIPASGTLAHDLSLPLVTGGARPLSLQAATRAGGTTVLGSPATLVVVDGDQTPACGGRLYVDADAPAGGDGQSWSTAFDDLHLALQGAPDCPGEATEIWIREGTYRPAPAGGDRERSFVVRSGTHLYGGFAGTESQLSQRDPSAHRTILSGDLDADDVGMQNQDDNAFAVVRIGTHLSPEVDVRIDGLQVSGGKRESSSALQDGTAFRVNGELTLVDCVVRRNFGWALTSRASQVTILNSVFARNAGGVSVGYGSRAQLVNCAFIANDAGLESVASDVDTALHGCLAYRNSSFGVRMNGGTISSSILRENGDGSQDAQIAPHGSQPVRLDRSCVQGLDGSLGGVGNVDSDPLFEDPDGPDDGLGTLDDDFRLRAGSACIDAGSSAALPRDTLDLDLDGDTSEALPYDLAGGRRLVDDVSAPNVGSGAALPIDMGPIERRNDGP